jgi:NTP pyrophosphatase (non-canonical NTP hydrolase)
MLVTSEDVQFIKSTIPEPAKYEQMAEECVELAQALLKKARKLRNENFTPKSIDEIDDNIDEEFNDVMLCAIVLDLSPSNDILTKKLSRWVERNKHANN